MRTCVANAVRAVWSGLPVAVTVRRIGAVLRAQAAATASADSLAVEPLCSDGSSPQRCKFCMQGQGNPGALPAESQACMAVPCTVRPCGMRGDPEPLGRCLYPGQPRACA